LRGVCAGATSGGFWIVLTLTYTIALGDFTHSVAGGAEGFMLGFDEQTGVGHALGGIIAPAPVGNVTGGTGLFLLLLMRRCGRSCEVAGHFVPK